MTDIVLTPVTIGYNLSSINTNFTKVQDKINNDVLHLTGGNNTLSQDLDLNGNRLINYRLGALGAPVLPTDAARLVDLQGEASIRSSADLNLQSQLTNLVASQQSGLIGYLTLAALNADLNKPAGTVALVTNDPTTANNTSYTKLGASGTGSWQVAVDRITNLVTTTATSAGAANTGFQQAGTGSVLKTVQSELRSSVRVEQFGAVADFNSGTNTGTDNTAAFQLAYNYIVAQGGGKILLGRGNYMGRFVVRHPYVQIEGEGAWATNLYNVDSNPVIDISNVDRPVSHITVSNLTINNRAFGTWSPRGISVVGVNTATNCDFNSFKNLYIISMDVGIYLEGRTIWNHWEAVRTANTKVAGLYANATNNIGAQTFINCRFGTSVQYGIYHLSNNNTIPSFNWAFYGCTVEQNLLVGMRITGATTSSAGIQAWKFDNCYFEENAYSVPVGGSGGLQRTNIQADTMANMLGLTFDTCTFFGDSTPQPNMDYGMYINTASMSGSVQGEVRASRFTIVTQKDIFWPKGLTVTNNIYSSGGLSTQRALGSVNIADLGNTHQQFTPILTFSGNTTGITYSNQIGRYLQIGNMIFFEIYISLTSKGSSGGAAIITGLPVNTSTAPAALIPAYSVYYDLFVTGIGPIMARSGSSGSATIELAKTVSGAAAAVTDADFGNSTRFSITGFYFT